MTGISHSLGRGPVDHDEATSPQEKEHLLDWLIVCDMLYMSFIGVLSIVRTNQCIPVIFSEDIILL